MIILGIDPGAKKSGYVYFDTTMQCIRGCGEEANQALFQRVIHPHSFQKIAIENIRGYGIVAGDDTFDTCIWIGRFDYKQEAILIGRKDVKKHLCGNTTTNDKYVRQALIDRFGEVGTKKNPGPLYGMSQHMWSALAVAVTAADNMEGEQ